MPPAPSQDIKTDLQEVLRVNAKAAELQAQNSEKFDEIMESTEAFTGALSNLSQIITKLVDDVKKNNISLDEAFTILQEQTKNIQNMNSYLYYHMQSEEKTINIINTEINSIESNLVVGMKALSEKLEALPSKMEKISDNFSNLKEFLSNELKSIKEKTNETVAEAKSTKGVVDKIEIHKYKLVWILGGSLVTGIINVVVAVIQAFPHK